MLPAAQVVPGPLVFLERNQVSQEGRLPLELPDAQETLAAQGAPSCLDRFPLVDLGARGGRGTQQPLFLHSGQGVLDPPEDL